MDQIITKKEFKGFSGNELKVFAIIAMCMDHLASTIWPLFLAAVGLYIFDDEKRSFPLKNWQKIALLLVLCVLAFPSDWSCFPVLCTLHIYQNRGNLKKQVLGMLAYISMYVLVWCLCIDMVYGLLQFGIIIVWPFMHFYNGTRGRAKWMKWFFLCILCRSPRSVRLFTACPAWKCGNDHWRLKCRENRLSAH